MITASLFIFACPGCNLDEVPDTGAWECGQVFKDPRDGKTYKTIWIANDGSHDPNKPGKCWMVESLDFNTANFFSSCYGMADANCDLYGRVYSKQTLANVCTNGWHVATADEWKELFQTYGLTEQLTGNGPIYSGSATPFLPGGNTKLDFLMGGSCLADDDCSGLGDYVGFWGGTDAFAGFNKSGSAQVWSTAVIQGASDLRYYVRCVNDN